MAKILVVDDEPIVLELVKRQLGNEGHEVMVAGDSEECFEILNLETPDVILLDIMMPDENGWDVCKKIKDDEKTKHIPVAMFSVLPDDESQKEIYAYAGAEYYIEKTFVRQELMEAIEKILENAPKKVKVSIWA